MESVQILRGVAIHIRTFTFSCIFVKFITFLFCLSFPFVCHGLGLNNFKQYHPKQALCPQPEPHRMLWWTLSFGLGRAGFICSFYRFAKHQLTPTYPERCGTIRRWQPKASRYPLVGTGGERLNEEIQKPSAKPVVVKKCKSKQNVSMQAEAVWQNKPDKAEKETVNKPGAHNRASGKTGPSSTTPFASESIFPTRAISATITSALRSPIGSTSPLLLT